jgi:hypothetical protein
MASDLFYGEIRLTKLKVSQSEFVWEVPLVYQKTLGAKVLAF